jgi:hydroxypyruvate isomerase
MPRFAANLSMMFNEVPFLDRFSAAAAAGFRGVEYLFHYDHEPEEIGRRLREHRPENVLFNLPPGDWAAGERRISCIPGREGEFRAGVEKALTYAKALGVNHLHAMAGLAPSNAAPGTLKSTYIDNLRHAAERLAARKITLLIEPINTRDMPGFYLTTQVQSAEVCAAVNLPNILMQFDCYQVNCDAEAFGQG